MAGCTITGGGCSVAPPLLLLHRCVCKCSRETKTGGVKGNENGRECMYARVRKRRRGYRRRKGERAHGAGHNGN